MHTYNCPLGARALMLAGRFCPADDGGGLIGLDCFIVSSLDTVAESSPFGLRAPFILLLAGTGGVINFATVFGKFGPSSVHTMSSKLGLADPTTPQQQES